MNPGKLLGIALAVVVITLGGPGLSAQISPGPLSRAHLALSGTTNCTSCHRVAGGNQRFKCLECHTEIAQRITAHRGYHAGLMQEPNNEQCARCHSEHNGLEFQLVHWQPSKQAFDHSKTGYRLEAKHAALTCQQCHNAAHISPAERAGLKQKDLNRTFLGLSRDCLTCHLDAHRSRLGQDCAHCHGFDGWKTVNHFEHSRTRFPLTGEHSRVPCQKCHKPDQKNPQAVQLVGMPFGKCADCHSDPHHGLFKVSCESCHTTAGWTEISSARVSGAFDHSKTKYPLIGKHEEVRCEQCHRTRDFTRPVPFARCVDCHTDQHQGQFVARQDGGDCASCHTVDGFKPSIFGVQEHAATKYPLEGKHASVACAKCHLPVGVSTVYKIKLTACRDCHIDIHKGQFEQAPHYSHCEHCHTVRGFKPSTFTLAKHQTTRFPLVGGHVAIPCIECHQAKIPPGSGQSAPYHFQDLTCTGCHVDPHRGEFAARMSAVRADGKPAGCEACHSTESWTGRVRFDHSTTVFPLTGGHRAVACISCHKPPNLEVSMRNVDFKSAPKECSGCHEDPHGGQFVQNGVNLECSSCHENSRWRPSSFDHEKRTIFSLQGAHRDVACADCHKNFVTVQGKSVLFYKPTPTQCAACHGPDVLKRT